MPSHIRGDRTYIHQPNTDLYGEWVPCHKPRERRRAYAKLRRDMAYFVPDEYIDKITYMEVVPHLRAKNRHHRKGHICARVTVPKGTKMKAGPNS